MFQGIKYHSVDVQGLNQRQLEVLAKGAQDALLQHLADQLAGSLHLLNLFSRLSNNHRS